MTSHVLIRDDVTDEIRTSDGRTVDVGGDGVQVDQPRTLTVVIDGHGDVIPTGVAGDELIDIDCTIVQVTLLADQAGDVEVDIWQAVDVASFPPDDTATITAAAKPTLAAAQSSQDAVLDGWTTAIAKGSVLRFNVDSAATITRLTVALTLQPGYPPDTAYPPQDPVGGTPPGTTSHANILSNGDFSGGDTGWADAPPDGWAWKKGALDGYAPTGIIAVPELDFDADGVRVYMKKRSRVRYLVDSSSTAGLVYTGDEWTPAADTYWALEFDFERIAEHDTNRTPYGIGATPEGSQRVWDVGFSYARSADPLGAGGIVFAGTGPGGLAAPGTTEHAFTYVHIADDHSSDPLQFIIFGFSYRSFKSNGPYGYAFKVSNVSLKQTWP